ncbi:ras-related protein rab-5b-related [Anaeramoeba flamelloides]|uniref:Ras-related protein rab-5b-related n=1 Tax=Anaeramoeba flamelloides TaxID=1746091 RepID=A0ABQ8X2M5_9EUKA|nr:ras-related protein rab-5b-related [Anaeramoeba flamelloides]
MHNSPKKIVLIGDSSVGKSSIVHRYISDVFLSEQEPTIGATFFTKDLKISQEKIKLQIWDTAGQERYAKLTPMYYRNAESALIVFDVNNPETYEKAKLILQDVISNIEHNPVLVLLGNKNDLEIKVDLDEIKKFCKENDLLFFLTSALTGDNVDKSFYSIAEKIYSNEKNLIKIKKNIISIEPKKPEKKICC